jgi:DNA-binding FadR family transcriptional regulator
VREVGLYALFLYVVFIPYCAKRMKARIAGAIAANDPVAAERAVHGHLKEAAEIARTLLEAP